MSQSQKIVATHLPELDERSRANTVKLVIHKGALLADPRGVMEGEGRYSRAIAFRSLEQIDADVLAPILREAAARQTEM